MLRAKVALVGLLSLLVIGGLASSASAEPKYGGFTGTLSANVEGEESLLESTIGGAKIIIKCEKSKGLATLNATTATATYEITLETCSLINTTAAHAEETLAACTVANPVLKITSKLSAGLLLEVTATGTNWTEIKITGAACAAKGTYALAGKGFWATVRAGISAVAHKVRANPARAVLTLATVVANFTHPFIVVATLVQWWQED